MSLFNTPSTILRLIQEAEQLKVSPDQDSSMPEGDGAGVGDITSELTSSLPPPPAPTQSGQPAMQVPGMTAPPLGSPTITKTMSDSQTITNMLGQMKATITNTEKSFQKGDVDLSMSASALGTMLMALKVYADELQKFMSSDTAGASTPAPDANVAPPAPAPTPTPAAPVEPNLGGI